MSGNRMFLTIGKNKLQDAIDKIRVESPIIEFAAGDDWGQVDPVNRGWRWRHHRSVNWAGWQHIDIYESIEKKFAWLDESTIRIVPRAEADDWRSRPAFPCHGPGPQGETFHNKEKTP